MVTTYSYVYKVVQLLFFETYDIIPYSGITVTFDKNLAVLC
jgi:hypothetical protein